MVLGLELGGSLAVELLDEVCVCSAAWILFLIHGHSRSSAGKSCLVSFPHTGNGVFIQCTQPGGTFRCKLLNPLGMLSLQQNNKLGSFIL